MYVAYIVNQDADEPLAHARADQPAEIPPTVAVPAMMEAIVQDAYGTSPATALRLAEVPLPSIGDGEVLVRVSAASVDKGTWHVMTGQPYAMRLAGFGVRAPKAPNPGRSLAGTVAIVGQGVTAFTPGDEVYGTCDGSFAEYASAKVGMLASKPTSLSFAQAAAVPISGSTALQALRKAQVQSGQHVLIVGASGGVGTFAVQIAKAFGAEVTGVCSTEKVAFVRSLGADAVIDYQLEELAAGGHPYDAIIDTGGNRKLAHLRRLMTRRGTLVIVGSETGGRWLGGFERSLEAVLLSPLVSQKLSMLVSTENATDLDRLRDLIQTGKITPAIDRTYPLSETATAIAYVQDGHARGKVVITM